MAPQRMLLPTGAFLLAIGAAGCRDGTATSPTPAVIAVQVTQVRPSAVAEDDAAAVSILGAGFQAGATVDIGGAATGVTVVEAGHITAFTPARPAGTVDVVVVNPDGRSARLTGGLTFVPFTVAEVRLRSGLPGDVVVVRGTGFKAGATVTMGGAPARVVDQGMTSIVLIAPEHDAGPVDVEVTNGGGRSQTLPGAFTYETVSLEVNATDVTPGADLRVTWTAPPARPDWDWLGFYREGASDGTFIQATYTDGARSGTFTVQAPGEPGQYEFRYLVCYDDHTCVAAARSRVVTVRAGSGS